MGLCVENDADPRDLEFLETQIRREASAAMGLGDEAELVEPHTTIDLVHGEPDEIVGVFMDLLLGANFNDPPGWMPPTYARMKVSSGTWA